MTPKSLVVSSAAAGLLLTAAPAAATYSIIAIDGESGQIGGVGTSCVGNLSLSTIFGFADGAGIIAAQAQINTGGRDRGVQLFMRGRTAAQVIAEITAPQFDLFASVRQYAALDVLGGQAGFTGDGTMAYADDRQAKAGQISYAVQGNILTGSAVLDQAASVFATPSCDLAETLMRALEAGALNGQGDTRCTSGGIPSDSAYLRVDDAEGSMLIELDARDTAPANPVAQLRVQFDAWRAEHACERVTTPDAGGVEAPVPDASAAADAATGRPFPDAGAVLDAAPAVPPDAGAAANADAARQDGTTEERKNDGGCSLASGRAASTVAMPWLSVLAALALRRRRTAR